MIRVTIHGPDTAGTPHVTMTASGRYAPDVAHDLKNRAVEAFRELFGASLIEAELDAETVDAELVDDESETDQ
jgi:hypothetical protein